MKNILILLILMINVSLTLESKAQMEIDESKYFVDNDYEKIYLNNNVTTHIISSLKIDYTDISTKKVAGQLAKDNMLALKPTESYRHGEFMGIITVVGEDYIKQYSAYYSEDFYGKRKPNSKIYIHNEEYYNNPTFELSSKDFKSISSNIVKRKSTYYNTISKANKMVIKLNNIFIVDGYYFVDFSVENNTNVRFDIDDVIYKINDKKIYKSANSQILYLQEIYNHYNKDKFKRHFRNIVAFEKFTIPNDKVFQIELKEKQISGRDIILNIEYSDFLKADVL